MVKNIKVDRGITTEKTRYVNDYYSKTVLSKNDSKVCMINRTISRNYVCE